MTEVAVAVVSWNTRADLERCLEALRADAQAGLAEVWVVDTGSSDGSPALVRERFPWARLEEPGDVGYGAAVNLVAERTAAPWLVAANADTAPQPGALAALLAAGAADPGAGALSPRLVLGDGTVQHSVYAFPSIPYVALFQTGLAERLPGLADRLCLEGHWDPARPRRVPWAVAAFLLLRREAFRAAGGFDPHMWLYAEDLDLGWRLRRAGWATRHVPGAVVHHASAASTTQAWGDDRVLQWQAATYDWLRRRRGGLRARAIYAINVAGARARARLAREGWRRERWRRWSATHRAAWPAGAPRRAPLRR